MDWILSHILEMLTLVGAFIATICWISVKIGTHIRDLNNLIIQTIPALEKKIDKLESFFDTRINRLESLFDTFIIEKITKRESPISLTPYAIEILKDIEFDKIFDLIKEELCTRLDEFNLHTKYDVQEMSNYLMRKIRDDRLCDPLKQAAFSKGYKLDEILSAASIPLRDYYLSIHPEINK